MVGKTDNMTLMGNFNCKEVDFQNWNKEENEELLGSNLLTILMENVLTQDRRRHKIQRRRHLIKGGLITDKGTKNSRWSYIWVPNSEG